MLDSRFLFIERRLFILTEALGKRSGIDQTFQPQLLGAEVLFQAISFSVAYTKLVEEPVVQTSQINGDDQNRRQTKDNIDKTEMRHFDL